VIIGFPANNFGSQEPGTNEEIASFANKITVLLSHDGQSIRKGGDMCAMYQFLTQKI
jgi:glutathione peroxidase